jgi:hypothetical protein
LAFLHPRPPRRRAFDRRSDLVSRCRERVELVGRAEHGHRDRAVAVVPQVVVVEVDAVLLGVQLQLDRRSLVRQVHLDEVATLVRVDASPLFAVRGRAGGERQR